MGVRSPIVFMCYARADDHDGKISVLRDELQRQVRLRTSDEDFVIYYDRESIRPGDLWARAISDAVEEAQILIVMVTPSSVTSTQCRREIEEFLRSAKHSRSGERVILPILYLHTGRLLQEKRQQNDSILDTLFARHHADWTHLRRAHVDSPEAGQAVDTLADDIADRLRKAVDRAGWSPDTRLHRVYPAIAVLAVLAVLVILVLAVWPRESRADNSADIAGPAEAAVPTATPSVERDEPSSAIGPSGLRAAQARLVDRGLRVDVVSRDTDDQPTTCAARPAEGELARLVQAGGSCTMYRAVLTVSGPSTPTVLAAAAWVETSGEKQAAKLESCLAAPGSGNMAELVDFPTDDPSYSFSSNRDGAAVVEAVAVLAEGEARASNDAVQSIADSITDGRRTVGSCTPR